jgi:hypothetical protein
MQWVNFYYRLTATPAARSRSAGTAVTFQQAAIMGYATGDVNISFGESEAAKGSCRAKP